MAFALTGGKRLVCRSRFKEVCALKHLMRFNLVLGLWLMISPLVLALLNQRMFRVLWEDFLLGLGIATFSFWRLWSRTGAVFADFMMMALGLITLLNPLLYHYFNVESCGLEQFDGRLCGFYFGNIPRLERFGIVAMS